MSSPQQHLKWKQSSLSFPARGYAASSDSSSSTRSNGTAHLARMMIPSDANVAGNVHGGTIMQLMEEAAGVAASRYYNNNDNTGNRRICAITARVERMTFQEPVHIGDVAKISAQVVFASAHTVAVAVQVAAERLAWSSGNHDTTTTKPCTVCNQALVWLVGLELEVNAGAITSNTVGPLVRFDPQSLPRAPAPTFVEPNPHTDPQLWDLYHQAQRAYHHRISKKQQQPTTNEDVCLADEDLPPKHVDDGDAASTANTFHPNPTTTVLPFSPDYSAVELSQVMLPSDCVAPNTGLVSGGLVLKLMDNASGIAATRHAGTNTVTVSVDCVNIRTPVLVGDVLRVRARPIFTSTKSMEVAVQVLVERFVANSTTDGAPLVRQELVAIQNAYFTFVSLPLPSSSSAVAASLPMRPLVVTAPQDVEMFQQGQRRYQARKAMRQAKQQQSKL